MRLHVGARPASRGQRYCHEVPRATKLGTRENGVGTAYQSTKRKPILDFLGKPSGNCGRPKAINYPLDHRIGRRLTLMHLQGAANTFVCNSAPGVSVFVQSGV